MFNRGKVNKVMSLVNYTLYKRSDRNKQGCLEENSKGANRQEEVRFGLSDGKSLTQRSGSREEASLWPGRGSAACTDGMRSAKSPGRKNMLVLGTRP